MSIENEHEFMEKEAAWEQQERIFQQILNEGMDAYLQNLPDAEKAFEVGEQTLCCMDEGTPMGDFRSAGSGILVEGAERITFVQSLKDARITKVTSHAGCGAAALYRELNNLTDKTVDEVAIEGAKQIAEEMGVPYGGHIDQLTRPAEFHQARVVYIDGTGRFNPSKVKGILPGFVVSRKYMDPSQAAFEVGIALAIAFGHHGFGEKFDSEHPLLIVSLGEKDQSEQLQQEIKNAIHNKEDKNFKDLSRIRFDHASTPIKERFDLAA